MNKSYLKVKSLIGKLRKIKHLHICESVEFGFLITTEITELNIFSFTNIFDYDSYTKIYHIQFNSYMKDKRLDNLYNELLALYKGEKKKKGRFKNVRRNNRTFN